MLYDNNNWIEKLLNAHIPKICIVRNEYITELNKFLESLPEYNKLLIAGSGLGLEAKILSKKANQVLGVDNNPFIVKMSQAYVQIPNVKFTLGDINNLPFEDKSYNAAILDFGTIGNFNDAEQIRITKELTRVSSNVYMDFYTEDFNHKRHRMYQEEGWSRVKIENGNLTNMDADTSRSLSKEHLNKIVAKANPDVKKIEFTPIKGFGYMTKIE